MIVKFCWYCFKDKFIVIYFKYILSIITTILNIFKFMEKKLIIEIYLRKLHFYFGCEFFLIFFESYNYYLSIIYP